MTQQNGISAGPAGRQPSSSAALKLIPAWLIVALPLGWGVYQTLRTSMALFRPSAPVAAVRK